jgi:hypothetical protein
MCITVFYILAYIQHNPDVLLEKKAIISPNSINQVIFVTMWRCAPYGVEC